MSNGLIDFFAKHIRQKVRISNEYGETITNNPVY